MREILFRGFTPDENGRQEIVVNGKKILGYWVYGNYWEMRETTYCFKEDYDRHPDNTKYFIIFDKMTDWGLPNRHLQADVIPETVGQFVGLRDKNHKQIFEGDILKERDSLFVVVYDQKWARFKLQSIGRGIQYPEWNRGVEMEVIGNTIENPELITKG